MGIVDTNKLIINIDGVNQYYDNPTTDIVAACLLMHAADCMEDIAVVNDIPADDPHEIALACADSILRCATIDDLQLSSPFIPVEWGWTSPDDESPGILSNIACEVCRCCGALPHGAGVLSAVCDFNTPDCPQDWPICRECMENAFEECC